MADFFDALTDEHRAFVARQPVFFVATAAAGTRINLSPKGMDSFRVLPERRVAYLDVAGSGNETNAHLARRRPDHHHVLRVRQSGADLPYLWPRHRDPPAGRSLERSRGAFRPAARYAPDLRDRGRSGADQLRLGRAPSWRWSSASAHTLSKYHDDAWRRGTLRQICGADDAASTACRCATRPAPPPDGALSQIWSKLGASIATKPSLS